MKEKIDLTLPEWVFLEATSHLGDQLKGRTLIQHIRSYTILEIFDTDAEDIQINPEVKQKAFIQNDFGQVETNMLIVVHFSIGEYANLDKIIDRAIEFYKEYSAWEDSNIINEETSKHN